MSEEIENELAWLRTPVSEQLAIAGSRQFSGKRILCTSLGRGQCAVELASRLTDTEVTVHFLEQFAARETREFFAAAHPGLKVVCQPDIPEQEFDAAVIPTTRGGESELTRETLQEAFHFVKLGGVLVATIDNPQDTWLHHELEKLGRSLSRQVERQGVIYILKKKEQLKRRRDFSCQFAFRDGETLVQVASRPSVFSHRRLDLGARALLEGIQVHAGERVLDIGCGSGAVGLALALREQGVRVHGLDANPRAAACLLVGGVLNGLRVAQAVGDWDREVAITSSVNDAGQVPEMGIFDLAVGNPPYFSNFKIADIFLNAALKGVRANGRVAMVTQEPEWFIARMKQLFKDVSVAHHRGYDVVSAVRK